MTRGTDRLRSATAALLRAIADRLSAESPPTEDVSLRLSTLEREVVALRRTVVELKIRLPRPPAEERCRCLRCGAHLVAVRVRATLGGQCPTCGGQGFQRIRARAARVDAPRGTSHSANRLQ